MDMTPAEAESLARGYAWGRRDAERSTVAGTAEGIEFGTAYREHVANGRGSRYSVQRAYDEWRETGTLPNVPAVKMIPDEGREDRGEFA